MAAPALIENAPEAAPWNPLGWDPYKTVYVVCPNRAYTGTVKGVRFQDGYARLDALSAKAAPEAVAKRIEVLNWFANSHPGPRGGYSIQDTPPEGEPE